MNHNRSIFLNHVANKIRTERRNSNMSMEQLAENSHVSLQTIKDIEHAKRACQIDTLVSIASSLHVSTDYIFGVSISDIKNVEFESVYNYLTEKQKKVLLEIAKVVASMC